MPSLRQRLPDNPYIFHVVVSFVSAVLLLTRRPDAFFKPQFWAEDGKVWYADAYNHGAWYSLMTPEAGYYQTVSRIVALFAQLFPFSYGPLIFNLAAISVKLLVINFLVSARMSDLIPDVRGRLALGLIYIALPHSFETHANLTNVQWHLGLLVFLVIIADRSGNLGWRLFDYTIAALSALSGPLCLLLWPIAAVKFLTDRTRSTLAIAVILTLGGLIQLSALLTTDRPSPQPLGAELGLAMKIIAGHLFISSIIGERGHGFVIKHSLLNDVTAALINLACFAVLVYAFVRSEVGLRLLIVFSVMIFATAMISPAITSDAPQWTVMWLPGAGSRYWLIPIFCLLVTLLYLAKHAELRAIRYISVAGLVLSLSGIAADWRYPRFKDLDFQNHASRFAETRSGETFSIPINPDWEMQLRKK